MAIPRYSEASTPPGLLPAEDVPTAILREVSSHRSADADDDAVVVCVDWYGAAAG